MKTRTYQFNLGEFQAYTLVDGANERTVEFLVADPDVTALEQVTQEYAFQVDKIPVGYNLLLLRTDNQTVLVDAGFGRPDGELHLALDELAIDPGEIDLIVITHSDGDHIGGILDEHGELTFPNARYALLDTSWQQWSTAKGRAELVELNGSTKERIQFGWEIYSAIRDRMVLAKSGQEFMPGLRLLAAPGHRHDHSVFEATSLDDKLLHLSDGVIHPLFLGNKAWHSTYDANPPLAVETKIELLNRCASEDILVFGTHFPFPALGRVEKGENRWRWQPLSCDPA